MRSSLCWKIFFIFFWSLFHELCSCWREVYNETCLPPCVFWPPTYELLNEVLCLFVCLFVVCLFVQYATCNLISKLRWVGRNGRKLLRTKDVQLCVELGQVRWKTTIHCIPTSPSMIQPPWISYMVSFFPPPTINCSNSTMASTVRCRRRRQSRRQHHRLLRRPKSR